MPWNNDSMRIEILEDGTIKTVTDAVSAANHSNAEQFLQFVARMTGGDSKRTRRIDVNQRIYEHEHGPHTYSH